MEAASKVFLLCFLVLFSMISVGFASGGAAAPPSGISLPCLEILVPCEPYLKAPSNPSISCCVPLNELVQHELGCLCQVFNNADLLKTINVTQDDALKLAQTCNADVDDTICKNVGISPSSSPATPATPSPSNSNSSPASPQKSAAGGVGPYLGVGSFFLFVLVSQNMGFF